MDSKRPAVASAEAAAAASIFFIDVMSSSLAEQLLALRPEISVLKPATHQVIAVGVRRVYDC